MSHRTIFLKVRLKLQSVSVHLLLQSSIPEMQLIEKKDLKARLLNKYPQLF